MFGKRYMISIYNQYVRIKNPWESLLHYEIKKNHPIKHEQLPKMQLDSLPYKYESS